MIIISYKITISNSFSEKKKKIVEKKGRLQPNLPFWKINAYF